MQAVPGLFVGRDVVTHLTGGRGVDQQVAEQPVHLAMGSVDPLVAVQHRREIGVVLPVPLVGDEREGLEHRSETPTSVS